jgi:hypothetical protein
LVDSDSGIGLDLVWASNRLIRHIEPWYSGGSLAITHLSNGGYFYFWERSEQNIHNRPYTDIEFATLSRHGFSLRNKLKLTNDSIPQKPCWHIENINASGASTSDGIVGVVWIKNIFDSDTGTGECGTASSTNSNVYFALVTLDGNLIGSPINLTNISEFAPPGSTGAPVFYEPHITATKDNRFIVTWVEFENYATIYSSNIYLASLDTSGILAGPPTQITSGIVGGDQYNTPNIAATGSSHALLTYSRYDHLQQKYYIRYEVFNSNGTIHKSATTVAGSDGYKPDAVELSSGNIALAWTNLATTRIAFAILEKTSYNILNGPTELTNPTDRPADYVSVTYDKNGRAIVTWMDARWNTSLFYALIDGNGSVLTPGMVSYQRLGTDLIVITSEGGQGNAFYDGSVFIYMPMIVR